MLVFDRRGVGLSDPVAGAPTLEERMDDVRAVMDAAGSERAALLGMSEGATMCMLFAATYPERTSALVLWGAMPRSTAAPDYPWAPEREAVIEAQEELIGPMWGQGATIDIFSPSMAANPQAREFQARFERQAASPMRVQQLFEMFLDTDVRGALPLVQTPTLILHRREQLRRFEGREIKSTGDGFLSTFGGPTRGAECARAIADVMPALGIELRAGLHTGEVELIGEDVGGIAVHVAARIAALAGPRQVLASRTVRDLAAGSAVDFQPAGRHALKGVPEEWDVYSVAAS